ncbi:hypothetical protein JCM3775_005343 [Rhodotorula graminis]|uniref:Uncharacterized protein n=1 Tax=Rhodotorula graminis (strain WP1) TaxID=578459 RepID=A0A0P9EP14_RHOGW|nr:uncharacterized protein RHOBADRAFT_37788 [Rhodotorula graminis WP1]KPV73908.1 hypothetical protein RHOBADRAFT_37788 [Rhodotorula graminis WP1]
MPRPSTRHASHAGSWYTSDPRKLDDQLSTWLEATAHPAKGDPLTNAPVKGCKAIIAPHAGYSYSGPAAAFAYRCIDVDNIKRVFVLGPSHHVYLDGCALSKCNEYETPIGNLPLDLDTIAELKATGKYDQMDLSTDEDEHSIEMHLPYVRKIFEGRDIHIVPILVGSISTASEKRFGALLAPYLADPATLFVVSSDFCHWGRRFRYTHYHPPGSDDVRDGVTLKAGNFAETVGRGEEGGGGGEVWEGIDKLDHLGMDAIAFSLPASSSSSSSSTTTAKSPSTAHDQFAAYLAATRNTICGRHPIGVLLGALAALEHGGGGDGEGEGSEGGWSERGMRCEWVRYEQSSRVRSLGDSSVSYASGFVAVGGGSAEA